MSRKAVILFSGGLDSTYMAWKYLQKGWTVYPLLATYPPEFVIPDYVLTVLTHPRIARGTLMPLKTFEYTSSFKEWNGRHIFFLGQAFSYANDMGASVVGLGTYEITPRAMPDARAKFVQAYRAMVAASEVPIFLDTLREEKSKTEVLSRLYNDSGLGLIHLVRFCYKGVEKLHDWGHGCGSCGSCKLMRAAVKEFRR